jgi:hypothetical protein
MAGLSRAETSLDFLLLTAICRQLRPPALACLYHTVDITSYNMMALLHRSVLISRELFIDPLMQVGSYVRILRFPLYIIDAKLSIPAEPTVSVMGRPYRTMIKV